MCTYELAVRRQRCSTNAPRPFPRRLRSWRGGPRTVLAGGTDLYPATERQALAGAVLDITGLAELTGIARMPGRDPHRRLHHLDRDRRRRAAARLRRAARRRGRGRRQPDPERGHDRRQSLQRLARRRRRAAAPRPRRRGRARLRCRDPPRAARGLPPRPAATARRPDEILTAVIVPRPPRGPLRLPQARRPPLPRHLRRDGGGRGSSSPMSGSPTAALAVGACCAVARRLPAVEARAGRRARRRRPRRRIDPAAVAAALARSTTSAPPPPIAATAAAELVAPRGAGPRGMNARPPAARLHRSTAAPSPSTCRRAG